MASEAGSAASPVEAGSVHRTVGLGIAAALAIAISVLGAGHAVGKIGAAAMGAAAEKPELLTRSILFVALAEGLAVLGFAVAMMLIQKI
jgi:V/A-type H+-transporting ATPase subunit K